MYQSCIVPAPGETGRRCPGIVLINTAPLSVPRQLLLWGEWVRGQEDLVHGLRGEGGGGGRGESLDGEERDPTGCVPLSGTSARVGWAPVCPHPWRLGMGRAVRHNGADGSEGEGTREATFLPCRDPDLTFGREERERPLERRGLGLREALGRAALHSQDCQGQKPKPLPRMPARCQPVGAGTAHGCHGAGRTAGLRGRDRAHPTAPSLFPGPGVEPGVSGCIFCLPPTGWAGHTVAV